MAILATSQDQSMRASTLKQAEFQRQNRGPRGTHGPRSVPLVDASRGPRGAPSHTEKCSLTMCVLLWICLTQH